MPKQFPIYTAEQLYLYTYKYPQSFTDVFANKQFQALITFDNLAKFCKQFSQHTHILCSYAFANFTTVGDPYLKLFDIVGLHSIEIIEKIYVYNHKVLPKLNIFNIIGYHYCHKQTQHDATTIQELLRSLIMVVRSPPQNLFSHASLIKLLRSHKHLTGKLFLLVLNTTFGSSNEQLLLLEIIIKADSTLIEAYSNIFIPVISNGPLHLKIYIVRHYLRAAELLFTSELTLECQMENHALTTWLTTSKTIQKHVKDETDLITTLTSFPDAIANFMQDQHCRTLITKESTAVALYNLNQEFFLDYAHKNHWFRNIMVSDHQLLRHLLDDCNILNNPNLRNHYLDELSERIYSLTKNFHDYGTLHTSLKHACYTLNNSDISYLFKTDRMHETVIKLQLVHHVLKHTPALTEQLMLDQIIVSRQNKKQTYCHQMINNFISSLTGSLYHRENASAEFLALLNNCKPTTQRQVITTLLDDLLSSKQQITLLPITLRIELAVLTRDKTLLDRLFPQSTIPVLFQKHNFSIAHLLKDPEFHKTIINFKCLASLIKKFLLSAADLLTNDANLRHIAHFVIPQDTKEVDKAREQYELLYLFQAAPHCGELILRDDAIRNHILSLDNDMKDAMAKAAPHCLQQFFPECDIHSTPPLSVAHQRLLTHLPYDLRQSAFPSNIKSSKFAYMSLTQRRVLKKILAPIAYFYTNFDSIAPADSNTSYDPKFRLFKPFSPLAATSYSFCMPFLERD